MGNSNIDYGVDDDDEEGFLVFEVALCGMIAHRRNLDASSGGLCVIRLSWRIGETFVMSML